METTAQFMIGSDVRCADGDCGKLAFVVVDPLAKKLTHLVVKPDSIAEPSRLVPVGLAAPAEDAEEGVALTCTRDEFEALDPAEQSQFLLDTEGGWGGYRSDEVLAWPFFGLAPGGTGGITTMAPPPLPEPRYDYRLPPGEVLVRRGERIHASDGEIGRVRGLVVDPADGKVSHVLLDEGHLWGRKRVAIPIRAVTGIDAEGVAVGLSKDEIRDLPPVDVEGLDKTG